MKQPETAARNARINALARSKSVPKSAPKSKPKAKPASTKTKSPLSIKETDFSPVPQVVQDISKGITPSQRHFIDPGPPVTTTSQTVTVRSRETDKAGITSAPPKTSGTQHISPIAQIVDDAKKGITPVERQIIEQVPSPSATTPSGTTTARRRKLEGTQEFSSVIEDKPEIVPQVIKDVSVGITPYERTFLNVIDKDTEQMTDIGPKVTSGTQLRAQAIRDISDTVEQYKEIDPSAIYVYESGEQISGSKLKQQMGTGIKDYLLDTNKIKSGLYFEVGGKQHRVKDTTNIRSEYKSAIEDINKQKLSTIRSITGHGEENIPEIIRDLGPSASKEYSDTVHRAQIGLISSEDATKKIQESFEYRLKEGSSQSVSVAWMKKHGTFMSDGKEVTWDELREQNPKVELKRYGGEFIVSMKPIDYEAWTEKQYKGMNPIVAGVRRGAATFLGGFGSTDYMYASQTGDPTDVRTQQKKLGEIINKWEYDTTHNIEKGDYLGVIGGIPAMTNIVAPYGAGTVFGAAFKGAQLGTSFLVSHGARHTGTALKYGLQGGALSLGAVGVAGVGADIYQSHQRDPDEATRKVLQYGTQFASFGAGMRSGSEMTEYAVKRAGDLLSRPSDMPKDVSGFRRLSPKQAKTHKADLLKKLHEDKVMERFAKVEKRMSPEQTVSESFIKARTKAMGKGKIKTQKMIKAYEAYGKDAKVTRIQDLKSVLAGRNIYVKPDMWHRFAPEQVPVSEFGGLLGSGKSTMSATPEPIKLQPGIPLKTGGAKLVFSSRTLGKPITLYESPLPKSSHWWGSLESDTGMRHPKIELEGKILESKFKPETLDKFGLKTDAFTIRKTTTGIPEVSYGPIKSYRVFDKKGGTRVPTFEETQEYLVKKGTSPVTKGKIHTEGTKLEDWDVFGEAGKKTIRKYKPGTQSKYGTGEQAPELAKVLEEIKKPKEKGLIDQIRDKGTKIKEWYHPENIIEHVRRGKHKYTIYEPPGLGKKTGITRVTKESVEGKTLRDIPASTKPSDAINVIRPVAKDGIYINGKTGKATLWYKNVEYEELGKGVWKRVKKLKDEAPLPKGTKIIEGKFDVIRPTKEGTIFKDVNTGEEVLQKGGKFFEHKVSKRGTVHLTELKTKVYTKKELRRYDLEQKMKQDLLDYEHPKLGPKWKEPWLAKTQLRGSSKQKQQPRFELELKKKKKIKKIEESVGETESKYVESSYQQGEQVSAGPESAFGSMTQKKSGWGGTSPVYSDDVYAVGVHKHWKDVVPSIKLLKPSIYGGRKVIPSSSKGNINLPIHSPGYKYLTGFGVMNIPTNVSGNLIMPIKGELPIERNEQDNFYGVTPVYKPDYITDTTPTIDTGVIPGTKVDVGQRTNQIVTPDVDQTMKVDYRTDKQYITKTIPPDIPEDDYDKKKLPIKMFRKKKYGIGYKEKTYDVKDMWSVTKFKKPKYFSLAKKR